MNHLVIVRPEYYDVFSELKEKYPNKVFINDSPLHFKRLVEERQYELFIIDTIFSSGLGDPLYWVKLFKRDNPNAIIVILNESLETDTSALLAEVDLVIGFDPMRLSILAAALLRIEVLVKPENDEGQSDQYLESLPYLDFSFLKLKSKSVQMRPAIDFISEAHHQDTHVLLLGEKGCGKDQVAKAIHRSSFEEAPFLNVPYVDGLLEDLIEKHLLFYKSKGTLFISNISVKVLDDLDLLKYSKLSVRLVFGSTEALHKPLDVNLKVIEIPPLRKRKEDIPLLANQFVSQFEKCYQKDLALNQDQLDLLSERPWFGNLNELRSYIEHLFFEKRDNSGDALSDDLQEENLDRLEKATILRCLKKYDKNISTVAKKLGVGRSTLYRKMKKYEIAIE